MKAVLHSTPCWRHSAVTPSPSDAHKQSKTLAVELRRQEMSSAQQDQSHSPTKTKQNKKSLKRSVRWNAVALKPQLQKEREPLK